MASNHPVAAARIRWWVVAPVIAAALFLVPLPPWVVEEFYSRDFYPFWQSCVTAISNLAPFAVIDLMIGGLVIVGVVRLVLLVRVAFRDGVLRALGEFARRVTRVAGVVAIVFVVSWGCNYRRDPLERAVSNGIRFQPTIEELELAVLDSNALAGSLRSRLAGEQSFADVAAALEAPMNLALRQVNRRALSRPGRPKVSQILTPFFTSAGVNGMVNPWALESIVHPELLPFERPFVLAHEWAHLAGQADEAEASAVGWLACMKGGPALAYSASLYLIMEAANALPRDSQRHVMAGLDAGVRADLQAIAQRATREDVQVRRVAAGTYDRYLRANRVADGNASYGRALTLILSPSIRSALNSYQAQ